MEDFNDNGMDMAAEPLLAPSETVTYSKSMPSGLDFVSIENGVLQITPDIEQEIEEVDRGEVVSMQEFKTTFAKWID